MPILALKSFLAALAAPLTLCVVALAIATTSSDETSSPASAGVTPSLATTSGPTPTEIDPAVPTSEPVAGEPTEEPPEDVDIEVSPEEERTTAVNPGGDCVDLPDSSNITKEPDKHSNWTIQPCQLEGDATPPDADDPEDDSRGPDLDEPNDDAGDGTPEGRTPARNPEGVCIEMPNNSDIIRQTEKHPKWTVSGCSASGIWP